jgi:hypothetical protein
MSLPKTDNDLYEEWCEKLEGMQEITYDLYTVWKNLDQAGNQYKNLKLQNLVLIAWSEAKAELSRLEDQARPERVL